MSTGDMGCNTPPFTAPSAQSETASAAQEKEVESLQTAGAEPQEERKQKKLKSGVWDHYDRKKEGKNVTATCLYCKKVLDGRSIMGTTHLGNHTNSCPSNPNKSLPKGQTKLGMLSSSSDPVPKLGTHKFDENVERRLFVKMVAKHDYPFLMAEHSLFREWLSYIYPPYKHRSRNTLRKDLDMVYEEEKRRIYGELEDISSRVSLTTDGWKPQFQNRSYFCLTCHYIDSDWTLHKRVIAFHVVPFPHDGQNLSHWLKERILEWNLDKKLSSVVVDNASSNYGMLEGVKSWLNSKDLLMSNGDMFHMRCAPHILNLIVKSGLEMLGGFIKSIIMTQRYISKSPKREEMFVLALRHHKFSTKFRIPSDVDTRWNSTYHMLRMALKLKEVIHRFALLVPEYPFLPSEKEWEDGQKICGCLQVFDEVTTKLSGYRYPTSNYYFTEVQEIRTSIKEWSESDDVTISLMAASMQVKFDKYWEDCNKLLTVAGVLDPRYKMPTVNFFFRSIYDAQSGVYEEEFREYLFGLFSEYKALYGTEDEEINYQSACSVSSSSSSSAGKVINKLRDFLATENYVMTSSSRKSQLEQYLEEPLHMLVDGFDILGWWRNNGPKYPIVAKMARDILAIPTSSVASESSFSRARRIITDTRSSLLSESVERLMSIKDWVPDILKPGDFKVPKDKEVAMDDDSCLEVNFNEDDWVLDPNFGSLEEDEY